MPPKKTQIEYVTLNDQPAQVIEFGENENKLPTFKMVVYTGKAVNANYSYYPIIIDLKGLKIPNQNVPVRFRHDPDKGVGHTTKIYIENGNVYAEGVISRETEYSKDIVSSSRNGFPWRVSIGCSVEKAQWIDENETSQVNGRTFKGKGYILRTTTMQESSFVDIGADNDTSATVKFSGDDPFTNFNNNKESNMTVETNGAEGAKNDGVQLENTEPKAEPKKEPVTFSEPTPKSSAISPEAQLAENRRIAAIIHFGNSRLPDLEAKAIDEGWTVEKFKGELNAKLMPNAENIQNVGENGNNRGLTASALEVIALRAAGFNASLEKQYEPKSLELADKYAGLGLQEFCQFAAGDMSLPNYRRDPVGWLKMAFSSVSLPKILSGVAHKTLLEGFNNVDETWKKIVKFGNVNNFYKHERYRMLSNFTFEKLSADGEFKHGKLGEENYEQEIDTYGIMFSLTRKMIINDDLGAFTDIPKNIGMGAGIAINDIAWQTFLNGATIDGKTLFHADHGNILADTALNIDGLTAAEEHFLTQKQPKVDKKDKDRPLGIPAKYLIVPTALKVAAEVLMKSAVLDGITELNGNINPHSGKFEIISSPYLQSSNYTGASSGNWYLMADPNRLAGFEIAFLSGKQHPTIESADADFNTLGIQFRGFIDFGVSAQEYRAALKLTPPA
jgi:hypothetical protein